MLPVLVSAGIYLFAHFLRSVRFWLLMEDPQLSLRNTFFTFQVTSAFGAAASIFVAEIMRVVVLIRLSGRSRAIEVLSMIVFCRSMDFLVASSPLLLNASLSKAVPLDRFSLLTFFLVGILLGLICCSQQALSFIRQVIVARGRTRFHLQLIRLLSMVENGFYRFLDRPVSIVIFNLLLTILIWGLDALAMMNITGLPLVEQLIQWSEHANGKFFHIVEAHPMESVIRENLVQPQIYIAGFLLIILIPSLMRGLKGMAWQKH